MTPEAFRAIRIRQGLTQGALADFLRLADSRAIRRYEAGDRAISGPIAFLMELLDAGAISLPDA